MRVMPRPKFPEERLLDLVVYVPLGLAMTIAEAVPELARKGRSRIEPQVRVARVLGQMAVKQGYKQVSKLASTRFSGPRPASSPFVAYETGHNRGPDGPVGRTVAASAEPAGEGGSQARPSAASRVGGGTGSAGLAIPSYDSLSAHQVVQRLAGLSRDEVAAVRDYERATRARRTIISRAEQLLS